MAAKDLPHDILIDILSKLPLKSLVRFRAVSKPWLHLITYSKFPYWLFYNHLSCNPLIPCPHNQSGLIISYVNLEGPSQCKLLAMGGGQKESSFKAAKELEFLPIRGKSFEIKTASCHGMICLAIQDDNSLLLWNPSIGDYRPLPVPEMEGFLDGVCGLGFDSSMDDYKVVSLYEKQVFVFSVKRNFWKNLGELPFTIFHEGVAVNGCLYWAASLSRRFGNRIICLNLADYSLREVSLPPFDFDHVPKIRPSWVPEQEQLIVITELHLLQWGNSLCAYRQYDQTMWLLKETRSESGMIREIWTKMVTMPKMSNKEYSHLRSHRRLQPKCFTKSGKLVVSVKRKSFALCDGVKYKDLHARGLENARYSKAIVYTESLISPRSIRSFSDID